jgi:hypothetical protein
MICCDSTSDKSTDTWKIGLELHDDDQTILSSSSSKINHQYQVFTIIGDNSEEFVDNKNPILNPAKHNQGSKPSGKRRYRKFLDNQSKGAPNSQQMEDN